MLHHLAVFKIRSVPVEGDFRSLIIGHHGRIHTTQDKLIILAHGIHTSDGVVSIEAETRCPLSWLDFLRHLEGDAELARCHADLSLIKHILMIIYILYAIAGKLHHHFRLLVVEPHPQ